MKKLYSFDNHEGDKGIIVANSWDEAVEILKEEYPDREIAETQDQYCDGGCFMEEIDFWSEENRLYVVCEW